MKHWVLDVGPLSLLGRLAAPEWAWPSGLLDVVREVEVEARKDWYCRELLDRAGDEGPWLRVCDMDAQGPAGLMLLDHLRPVAADATADLGEHASIAYCFCEAPDALFVTMDTRAAYLALAELGPGRVATPYDLWLDLRSAGLLTPETHTALNEATLKQRQNQPGLPLRLRSEFEGSDTD